jgi:hypothetical protein
VGAVDAFVREGGGLVASLDTSLFNEFGDPRNDFALASVLGVQYRGLPDANSAGGEADLDVNFAKSIGPDYWEKRKNVFDFRQETSSFLNQGKMQVYVGPDPVTFKGPAIRVAVTDPEAKIVGHLANKFVAGAPSFPGIVTRTHGKGRVVYLAGGLDAGYYLYAYPYQRLVLAHAMQWAAASPQPVVVKAPMCVHSTVMRQTKKADEGTERLVVHLFSDLNTSGNHAFPGDDVPLREEVVPIHDITVRFAPGYQIRRIHLEPEGLDLKPSKSDEGTTVVVPRLDVHTMVVAEIEGPR